MSCEKCRYLLWSADSVRRELPSWASEHLDACGSCAREWAARRELGRELRLWGERLREPPGELRDRRVLRAVTVTSGADDAPVWLPHSLAPPRAPGLSLSLLLGLSLVVLGSVAFGFGLGHTGFQESPSSGPTDPSWLPPTHHVGFPLSEAPAFWEGSTYLLVGPPGGPYQVVGTAEWSAVDELHTPFGRSSELVVAVGPAGGWSRGKSVAIDDLAATETRILARRVLDKSL